MANVIKLHKGLNINLKGKPAQEFFDVKQPEDYPYSFSNELKK